MKTLLYFVLFMVAVYGCASGKPLLAIFSTIPFCALLLVYIKLAYKTPKAKCLQRKTIKTTETELKEINRITAYSRRNFGLLGTKS